MTRTGWSILGILVLIILILLGVWYFFVGHGSLPGLSGPTATSTTASSTAATATSTPSAPANEHVTESSQYYAIDLQYPSQTPLAQSAGASADAAAVALMKQYAESTAATFISEGNFASMTPAVFQDMGGEQEQLTDTYVPYTGSDMLSYVYTVESDTGGAHPNSYYKSFMFNASTGQPTTLSDLFTPGSNYLQKLSTLSAQQLTQILGANGETSMISSGTQPTAANFANYAIDGNTLIIFFAPYQVAAYAYGPQTVKIPLSQLSSILKSTYE